jgi:hypothetical protein
VYATQDPYNTYDTGTAPLAYDAYDAYAFANADADADAGADAATVIVRAA